MQDEEESRKMDLTHRAPEHRAGVDNHRRDAPIAAIPGHEKGKAHRCRRMQARQRSKDDLRQEWATTSTRELQRHPGWTTHGALLEGGLVQMGAQSCVDANEASWIAGEVVVGNCLDGIHVIVPWGGIGKDDVG